MVYLLLHTRETYRHVSGNSNVRPPTTTCTNDDDDTSDTIVTVTPAILSFHTIHIRIQKTEAELAELPW